MLGLAGSRSLCGARSPLASASTKAPTADPTRPAPPPPSAQELLDKAPHLPPDILWHFIGHLQSNKARALVEAVPNLAMVETVDSEKLASRLDAAAEAVGEHPLPGGRRGKRRCGRRGWHHLGCRGRCGPPPE